MSGSGNMCLVGEHDLARPVSDVKDVHEHSLKEISRLAAYPIPDFSRGCDSYTLVQSQYSEGILPPFIQIHQWAAKFFRCLD
jgi:hypothetical protein